MNTRKYKKYTEVYTELEQRCTACRPGDIRILPGECDLAAELQTSRMTLRKALKMAEMNGLISRKHKVTTILPPKSLRQCGKILFITPGYNRTPVYNAFYRLWIDLKSLLEKLNADLELLLINESTTEDEIESHCEAADVILLTLFYYGCPAFLNEMKFRKTIIALSEPYLDQFDNYIALDNYAAGELAARALQLGGCRNPVFIGTNSNNSMFHKRFCGFSDAMRHIGIDIPKGFPPTGFKHFTEIRRKELLNAVRKGCDGAFIASDEGIGSITLDLFGNNLIPEKFKLVTLNGCGEALLCSPPITCVNHANERIASTLVGYLKRHSENPNIASIKKLVQPDLYLNKTIGKIDINLTEGVL